MDEGKRIKGRYCKSSMSILLHNSMHFLLFFLKTENLFFFSRMRNYGAKSLCLHRVNHMDGLIPQKDQPIHLSAPIFRKN